MTWHIGWRNKTWPLIPRHNQSQTFRIQEGPAAAKDQLPVSDIWYTNLSEKYQYWLSQSQRWSRCSQPWKMLQLSEVWTWLERKGQQTCFKNEHENHQADVSQNPAHCMSSQGNHAAGSNECLPGSRTWNSKSLGWEASFYYWGWETGGESSQKYYIQNMASSEVYSTTQTGESFMKSISTQTDNTDAVKTIHGGKTSSPAADAAKQTMWNKPVPLSRTPHLPPVCVFISLITSCIGQPMVLVWMVIFSADSW